MNENDRERLIDLFNKQFKAFFRTEFANVAFTSVLADVTIAAGWHVECYAKCACCQAQKCNCFDDCDECGWCKLHCVCGLPNKEDEL